MHPEKKVLNVGGNSKAIPLPKCFEGFTQHLMDIDPSGQPDLLGDAKDLLKMDGGKYDAVYSSHFLEHVYQHEVPHVLAGFYHITNADGWAWVITPNLKGVMQMAVEKGLEPDDVLYRTGEGIPIHVHDVIYGWQAQIKASGQPFFAHKCGFSKTSLSAAMSAAGFQYIIPVETPLDVMVLGFKKEPSPDLLQKIANQ